jgi:hypothetical protein
MYIHGRSGFDFEQRLEWLGNRVGVVKVVEWVLGVVREATIGLEVVREGEIGLEVVRRVSEDWGIRRAATSTLEVVRSAWWRLRSTRVREVTATVAKQKTFEGEIRKGSELGAGVEVKAERDAPITKENG